MFYLLILRQEKGNKNMFFRMIQMLVSDEKKGEKWRRGICFRSVGQQKLVMCLSSMALCDSTENVITINRSLYRWIKSEPIMKSSS